MSNRLVGRERDGRDMVEDVCSLIRSVEIQRSDEYWGSAWFMHPIRFRDGSQPPSQIGAENIKQQDSAIQTGFLGVSLGVTCVTTDL